MGEQHTVKVTIRLLKGLLKLYTYRRKRSFLVSTVLAWPSTLLGCTSEYLLFTFSFIPTQGNLEGAQ